MKHTNDPKLDFACLDCVKKHIEHKDRLIDFLKDLINDLSDDDFIFDKNESMTIKGETYYKSEFLCFVTKIKCEELLAEIKSDED